MFYSCHLYRVITIFLPLLLMYIFHRPCLNYGLYIRELFTVDNNNISRKLLTNESFGELYNVKEIIDHENEKTVDQVIFFR